MRGAGGGRLPLTLFTGEQRRVAHTALGVQVDFVSRLHPVLLDGAMPRAEVVEAAHHHHGVTPCFLADAGPSVSIGCQHQCSCHAWSQQDLEVPPHQPARNMLFES